MELSTVSLFWRDLQACCFTQLRLVGTGVEERVSKICEIFQQLSTLQIYGIVINEQPIQPNQLKPPPPSGTENRLLISLFPSTALNPPAGINYIKFAIPGPRPEVAQTINQSQPNMNHPYWQMLDQEVIPFLSLPNGITVHPMPGVKRFKSVAIIEVSPEHRPQPGRPPIEAALLVTAQCALQARSAITRLQRANQQPTNEHLARVEKHQKRLAHLQLLQDLERDFFTKTAQSESIFEVTIRKGGNKALTELPLPALHSQPGTSSNKLLPTPPTKDSLSEQIWADLPLADLLNPQCWLPIGELKHHLDISSDRSFWRSLQTLRSVGLRTLPAQMDTRVQLFYLSDLPTILGRWQEHKPRRGRPTTAPATTNTSTPFETEVSHSSLNKEDKTEIWTAINKLAAQQEKLLEQQNIMTQMLARIESSLANPISRNYRQFSRYNTSPQPDKAEVMLYLECSPPLLADMAQALSDATTSIKSIVLNLNDDDLFNPHEIDLKFQQARKQGVVRSKD